MRKPAHPDHTLMQPVVSSNISAIGYDEETRALLVRFRSSGTYIYDDVPAETHAELMASDSKGAYFAANIRKQFLGTKAPAAPREPVNVLAAGE